MELFGYERLIVSGTSESGIQCQSGDGPKDQPHPSRNPAISIHDSSMRCGLDAWQEEWLDAYIGELFRGRIPFASETTYTIRMPSSGSIGWRYLGWGKTK